MPLPYIIGAAVVYGACKVYKSYKAFCDEELESEASEKIVKEKPVVDLEKKRLERVNGWKKEFFEAWVQALLKDLPKQYEKNDSCFFVPLRNNELLSRSPISEEECFPIMKKAVHVACKKIGLSVESNLRFAINAIDTISGEFRYLK